MYSQYASLRAIVRSYHNNDGRGEDARLCCRRRPWLRTELFEQAIVLLGGNDHFEVQG